MIKTTLLLFSVLLLFSSLLYSTIQHILAQSDTNDNDTKNTYRSQVAAVKNSNSTFLKYQIPDFEIKMQYPSNWTKQEDNLALHTIVGFSLIHQDVYDFTNTTLAELDLRVYNAPQNETFAKLNIDQVNHIGQMNTTNQVIIGHYKNATTTLAGLPALKIINYYFGNVGQKEMQFGHLFQASIF
jgi:hypothetical protein